MKTFRNLVLLILFFKAILSCKRGKDYKKDLISEVIENSSDSLLKVIWSQRKDFNVQVNFTQIINKDSVVPKFQTFSYPQGTPPYFYPASTVKLPIAILALEKLSVLQSEGIAIDHKTLFKTYDNSMQVLSAVDKTHSKGWLTIGHLIKKIFLVSDNEAFNYLYDFLGTDYINQSLNSKGIEGIRIVHKLSSNAISEVNSQMVFFSESLDTLYHQPILSSSNYNTKLDLKGLKKGKGFYKNGEYLAYSMDFSTKNYISLNALHGILRRIIFPESFSKDNQFNLEDEDLNFLRYWMSRVPTEINEPYYDRDLYFDSYCKFFMYGDTTGEMTPKIRIYNKIGLAYGTVTDVAYITNHKGLSFMLSACLEVNENQIFNDDVYEYDTIGIPFLAALGRAFYNYELKTAELIK